ncbi:hypothetical protein ACT40Q_00250 [Acinetobacter baumannii]|uniref:hypothetical protein n=1 Tax=Acinetobacter pittii TaxID=48296 RepID=UPI001D05F385|nr:hypothetical protein [Acinetobacter pittii]
MLNNIKLPFNINLLEALSIAGLIAVLFSVTYKVGYYDGIGLPWLVGTMNSQLILNSSINFLILFIPFLLIGWFIMQITKKSIYNHIIYTTPYLLGTIFLLLSEFKPEVAHFIINNIYFLKNIKFLISISSLFTGIILYYIYSNVEHVIALKNSNDQKTKSLGYFFSLTTSIMMISILISSPYGLGKYIGENTIKNLDPKSKIELSSLKDSWYIIEVISDKAVIYERDKKVFKIIELKDIHQIKHIDTK